MTGEGEGHDSPPPLPLPPFFFCSRSNLRAITRLETLGTQASLQVAKSLTGLKLCATTPNNMQQGVQTDATCNIQQCCVRLHRDLSYYLTVTPHIYLFSRYRGLSGIEVHHTRRKARIPWCHGSCSRCNCWTGAWYRDTTYILVGFYCMRLYGSQEKSLWLRGAIIHWLVCCCLPFYRSKFENVIRFPVFVIVIF